MATTRRTSQRPIEHGNQKHPGGPSVRWECRCQTPPVLLATWEEGGRVNIKVRDRYWHFEGFGKVHAVCPRCASEHVLDLALPDTGAEYAASTPDS